MKRTPGRNVATLTNLRRIPHILACPSVPISQRMAMVDMRSAVERHTYAPGCRPKAPAAAYSWGGVPPGGRGKAKWAAKAMAPSLLGVFGET